MTVQDVEPGQFFRTAEGWFRMGSSGKKDFKDARKAMRGCRRVRVSDDGAMTVDNGPSAFRVLRIGTAVLETR